ncbi:MAG: hypothetical protein APF77_15600 [Clostridia bacterium BRH_c25]|nr:MAG: hypothetical protein APF77_15600 [Clostridia bacterium BRH_c25]
MKIKRTSLPDEVCSRIKENIKNNQWKVYDKIPSEGELAEMFGVNRLTIRMALQKLNTLGIVETRVGEGTFVRNFSFSNYIKEVSEYYMRPELLEDVCEFRKLLEIDCARLAIERGTPEDLKELKDICDKYDSIRLEIDKSQDLDRSAFKELINVDLEFHQKIVKMSKNSLYIYSFIVAKESIYQYLAIIIKQRMDSFITKYKSRSMGQGSDLHRVIYQAIVDKDFETCKKAYLDMVDHKVDL